MIRSCVATGVWLLLSAAITADSATLYGLVDTGELFESTDAGASLSVRAALPSSDAVDMQAGALPTTLHLITRSGLTHRSIDEGESWAAVGSVGDLDVVALGSREDGQLLALTRRGLLWRSSDDGVSFEVLASLPASNLVDLARPRIGSTLLILAATGEVWSSEDDGASWTIISSITTSSAVQIVMSQEAVYVLGEAGTIWRSDDGGSTFAAVGTLSQVHMSGLVMDQGGLLAATREGTVAVSADGVGWSWVGTINQLNVVALSSNEPLLSIPDDGVDAPPSLIVGAPWPNPLRAGARRLSARVSSAGGAVVTLELFDVTGRRVHRAAPVRVAEPGPTLVSWDLPSLSPANYFLRLETGADASATRIQVLD